MYEAASLSSPLLFDTLYDYLRSRLINTHMGLCIYSINWRTRQCCLDGRSGVVLPCKIPSSLSKVRPSFTV